MDLNYYEISLANMNPILIETSLSIDGVSSRLEESSKLIKLVKKLNKRAILINFNKISKIEPVTEERVGPNDIKRDERLYILP